MRRLLDLWRAVAVTWLLKRMFRTPWGMDKIHAGWSQHSSTARVAFQDFGQPEPAPELAALPPDILEALASALADAVIHDFERNPPDWLLEKDAPALEERLAA